MWSVWRSWRFYLILAVSFWGLVLTQYWYVNSQIEFGGGGRKPVAYVFEKRNDVQQKYVDRLIWKPAVKGQPIYHGDTIRTAADSQVDVVFTKSGASVFLNEDSQVVIDVRKGETTLNLLSGSLLAKGDVKAPTVMAGNTKIEMAKQKTELVVSVNKKQELSGCVYSGAMSLEAGGANKETFQSGNCSEQNVVSTLGPKPNAIMGRVSATGLTKFDFTGPATPYEADLYIGRKKNEMIKVASVAGQSAKGSIQAVAPDGVFFWQIVVREGLKEKARSLVLQSEMITIVPPTLVVPQDAVTMMSDKDPTPVTLSWNAPKYVRQFRVQVAKDQKFGQADVFDRTTESSEVVVSLAKNQVYYWRVLAYWKDENLSPLSSSSRKFSIIPASKLVAPRLLGPKDNDSYAVQPLSRAGLVFSWAPVPDASGYSVQIAPETGKPFLYETKEASFRWDKPVVGDFRWTVRAINPYEVSPRAAPHRLVVLPYFPVNWIKPDYTEEQSDSEKPLIRTQWSPVAGVVQWSIVYENSETKARGSHKFTKPGGDLELSTIGKWRMQIFGYDASGTLLGSSSVYTLTLTLAPFLQAPFLTDAKDFSLKGRVDGSVDLRWNLIRGGKSYMLALKKGFEKEKVIETDKLEYQFKDLEEGTYNLRLMTKNSRGLPGPPSKNYKILIPKDLGTPPPVLKNIKVKM